MTKSNQGMGVLPIIVIIAIVVLAIVMLTREPAEVEAPTETPIVGGMEESPKNIVETAVEAGTFTTLVAAVQAAGLVDVLSGPGPFTVFAPTDEAFAKLPEGTVESLLADPETLASILTYHVVAGKVMAADVLALSEAETVQGGVLTISTSNGVMVNNANVVVTDIETSNGVIHVIDTVLIPE